MRGEYSRICIQAAERMVDPGALALLRDKAADPALKDTMLANWIHCHQTGDNDGCFFRLLAAMWPVVLARYRAKLARGLVPLLARGYDFPEAKDHLFAQTFERFLRAVDTYPLARRPHFVAANLRGLLWHRDDEALLSERREKAALQEIEQNVSIVPDPWAWSSAESAPVDAAEDLIRMMAPFVDEGTIRSDDAVALIDHHAFGKTCDQIAAERGRNVNTVKKRLVNSRKRLRRAHPAIVELLDSQEGNP